ncbi:DNA repair protein RecN [Kordiimonas gwangyangensis]|uniref:DNA repair protein RecN n=1 Tax=Kordiimonas gwangyangensis TaxID=288022 RepID=UPI00036CB512|nr:DNA repair protein RecN [Kordiimonas gwangyangensis]
MLTSLSIRDIVLIDKLDLSLAAGLTVLTGETGAGKSILLDSLGLATGARADRALVRLGQEKGTVTAAFSVTPGHPACALLDEQGMDAGDGEIILRRQITSDGRSRAWANDQPVSQGTLSDLGALLVEVHGQHDDRGLLDASAHRALLDAFGGYGTDIKAVAAAHEAKRATEKALAKAERELAEARRDEEFLAHAVDELKSLNPLPGEETELSDRRSLMMQGEKLAEDLGGYQEALAADGGVDAVVRGVLRRMERTDAEMARLLTPVMEALDRAAIELGEAVSALDDLARNLEFDPLELERTEERLFEIRRLARKHNCQPDDLAAMRDELEARHTALEAGDETVKKLRAEMKAAAAAYITAAKALSAKRVSAAKRLDELVMAELPPLKLEKAIFRTAVEELPEAEWSSLGADRVSFEVKTNPGTPFGPLVKIASGGELARFILALKVVLAKDSSVPVMVFDEVDRGIGGATASAVGERLKRLSEGAQVLVVTHSPQVAARGDCQFQIAKGDVDGETRTNVGKLTQDERREEIARMLAGEVITNEARAAADKLLTATQ